MLEIIAVVWCKAWMMSNPVTQWRICYCTYHAYYSKGTGVKSSDQWEWIGLWKVAIDRHLVRIVVIDILFYFNFAAILEYIYFHFRFFQLID